jgi:hypothetical protein
MGNVISITEAHVLAVLAGVLFGSAAISTACWVWLQKQIFAFGGSALCGAGVVLLGLSIWHSVEVGVSGGGLSLKLQAEFERQSEAISNLHIQMASVEQAALAASNAATANARTGQKLANFTRLAVKRWGLSPNDKSSAPILDAAKEVWEAANDADTTATTLQTDFAKAPSEK